MTKHLFGHGRIICSECNKIISSCRCMKCGDNVNFDICDECKEKEKEKNNE